MYFQDKLKDLVSLFENWLPEPEDKAQIEQWIQSADDLADSYEFSNKEMIYVDKIIEIYGKQFREKISKNINKQTQYSKEVLNELLNRKQIEQRTPEWYAQMTTIISASELGNLFASPRTRAKMVMVKTEPYKPRNQPLAVTSDRMSAFDWGIRFEPVVKQIYEYKYKATVKELGRLYHQTDHRCTASPDGLVYDSYNDEKTGRLIEIKCPVTREIDGSVPKDYYAQMQMQLHVTGLKMCDYIEASFLSIYNNSNNNNKEGPGLYNGYIVLIRYSEITEDNQEFYYIYSPVNCDLNWTPDVKENEEVVEIIPWSLMEWSEQVVTRSEEWWQSIIPIIDKFWEDVEKAKRGEFVVPESTRAKKEEKCMIMFKKLDENGNEIIS